MYILQTRVPTKVVDLYAVHELKGPRELSSACAIYELVLSMWLHKR